MWIHLLQSLKQFSMLRVNNRTTKSELNENKDCHDDVIKWKHFPRYWPFVQGIHRLPVNSPHKGQWCRALMFSLICTWIKGSVNNCEAGDLRCHCAHYDVKLMCTHLWPWRSNFTLRKKNKIYQYFLINILSDISIHQSIYIRRIHIKSILHT